MNKIGHLLLGAVIGFLFIFLMNRFYDWFDLLNLKTYCIITIIIFIYSLLPDIDHQMSKITWIFLGVGIFGSIYGTFCDIKILYFSLGLLILTFVSARFLKHRGIIHTIWIGAITSIPIGFIFGKEFMFLAFIVFYSHLLGDGYILKIK